MTERFQMTSEDAEAIWKRCEAEREKRAADMPDERAAIRVMMQAFQRLKELDWREAIYCPKDGTEFDVIEAGSMGIHRCCYMGKWPTGSWILFDEGDSYPSTPILFRLDPEEEAARKQRMTEVAAKFWAEKIR